MNMYQKAGDCLDTPMLKHSISDKNANHRCVIDVHNVFNTYKHQH